MSKAVGAIAVGIALVAVAVFVPGVGTAIAGAAFSASAAAGATLSAATLAAIQAGAATLIVATGLTIAANGLQMARAANAISQAQLTRLNVSLDPSAPRKIAFGHTALATDLRASIPTGADQEYHEYVICVASHTVESITEIWFEDRQAWTVGGGIASYYSGYLTTVTVRNPGTNANGIAINSQWPATSTLTGCAYVYLKVKRTGNSKKAESVLPQGIPSRVTIIGKGMKVYDPRLDSTVTGGSGTHRADDQTTWEYSHSGTDIGNNPALQILAYRLGWQINSKLAVGKGMLPERLDLPSFITAANICDEPVTLAIGGTQRRYETHAVFSENDATSSVENALLFACAGRMTDHNGKLGIALAYNDLTGTLYEFTDDDVLGAFDWNPSPSIHETHNIIRGRWTDPSSNSLYQMVDYPAIRITSPDGIDRTLTIDLPVVQDGKRAQRIAKQILQREQYQGTFAAIFGIRAWGVKVGDPVKLTFDTLGFVEKLFRVVQQGIRSDGTVQLILREEATALYAWSAEASALVTVAAPTVYDQLNNPLAIINGVDIGVENGADVTANAQVVVTAPALVEYAADYLGNISGSLSSESVRVSRGGTSIKTDAGTSYAFTANGGITGTADSPTKGDWTPSAFTSNTASVDCVVTVDTVVQPRVTINFAKRLAAPPEPGGGSNPKLKTATGFSLGTSDTSFVVLVPVMTVTIATGESLYATAPLDYEISGTTTASRTCTAKWQYSVAGANSWSDFPSSPISGSAAYSDYYINSSEGWAGASQGYIAMTQTKPTPGVGDWDVRVIAFQSASGRTMTFYGPATIESKV